MTMVATIRNLLLGLILMVIATSGCGDHSEPQPSPQPEVFRKKITMPQEPVHRAVKPRGEVPQVAQVAKPGIEPAPEAPVAMKRPEEKAVPGKMVRRPIAQPANVEPPSDEKKPQAPPDQEAQVAVEETKEKVADRKAVKRPPPEPTKAEPSPAAKKPLIRPEEKAAPGPLEAISKRPRYAYDKTGKIDPFKPLFEIEAERLVTAKRKVRKKRPPLTPLQKVTLGQLKVVGIILLPGGNRALVEDPAGKGYIVYEGTYIGQNFGQVKEILKDKIVVEEELEDFVSGKMRFQITELELREDVGEM